MLAKILYPSCYCKSSEDNGLVVIVNHKSSGDNGLVVIV